MVLDATTTLATHLHNLPETVGADERTRTADLLFAKSPRTLHRVGVCLSAFGKSGTYGTPGLREPLPDPVRELRRGPAVARLRTGQDEAWRSHSMIGDDESGCSQARP